MPDEDERFGDVAAQLRETEEGEDAAEDTQSAPEESTPETGTEPETEPEQENEPESAPRPDASEESDPGSGPAFAFEETDMHGFYVRDETWEDIKRMRSSVAAVCSMFDVPEYEGREFQDACLRVVAEHGDEVALQILRERGIEADEDRVQEVVEMLNEQATND